MITPLELKILEGWSVPHPNFDPGPALALDGVEDKDRLTTDINYKITDTEQHLHNQSNHPRHIKRNIPHNLARRILLE